MLYNYEFNIRISYMFSITYCIINSMIIRNPHLQKNDLRVKSYRHNYLISLVDPCIISLSNVQSVEYIRRDAVVAHFAREY